MVLQDSEEGWTRCGPDPAEKAEKRQTRFPRFSEVPRGEGPAE